MLLDKTIRLFLDSIGRREEYEFYLNKFHSVDTACFALLVPDLECLQQGVEALSFDLHFLLRLGLRPAVVLCGPDADSKWALLAANPLFEKVSFSAFATLAADKSSAENNADKVPVLFREREPNLDDGESCFQCLEIMIPTIGKRVHFIRVAGGFDVEYYYTQKENPVVLEAGEQVLADSAAALLAARPGTHISVTSPMNLLEEIFTVKGAGTLFRKGSKIITPDFASLDRGRLLKLLRDSFKKAAKSSALDQVTTVYLEESYRGAVLLEDHPEGLYLSKFAVGPEARGEGLAQELWDDVCKRHASFFWRSRVSNPVNQWYDRQADGYYTSGQWVIFWRGMPAASLSGIIEFCTNRPSDFE